MALQAERGKTPASASPKEKTVLPAPSTTTPRPRWRLSTSAPRVTSTVTGFCMVSPAVAGFYCDGNRWRGVTLCTHDLHGNVYEIGKAPADRDFPCLPPADLRIRRALGDGGASIRLMRRS